MRTILALLILAAASHAAIQKDSSGSNQSATGASSLTVTFTVGTGLSNSKIVCGVGYYDLTKSVSTMSVSPAAAGGSSFTKDKRENDGSHNAAAESWHIDSPTAGSNTITITMTGSISASSAINAVCYSFSGMLAGGPENNSNCAGGPGCGSIVTGTNSSHLDNIATALNGEWVIDFVVSNGGSGTETASGSQINAVTQVSTSAGCLIGSTLAVAVAGTTSVGATYPSSGNASASVAVSYPAVLQNGFPIVADSKAEKTAAVSPRGSGE